MNTSPSRQEPYDPARRKMWDPSPQTEPDLFSDVDIRKEIRYLRSLNRRHGEATLRTLAIVRLVRILAERNTAG